MTTNTQKFSAKIRLTLQHHGYLRFGSCDNDIDQIIAAKIEPLVEDAKRWKSECEAVRSLANKYELRADDADRYEQWLLDIGKSIGCQHLDEQLPNCVIQHLQGDQESEATHE